ncbi:ribosome 60S biogenesis N-terminal-domain-containing protein [Melanogaster broomeanus]|nr:ribosome 60S biogenesis N-terminal-domain-containing protein [Melanogaster broomeanus]
MSQVTTDLSRPRKRAKLDQPVSHLTDRFTFTTAQDIRQALRTQDPNALPKAPTVLSALRAKLSLKSGETISPHDERLALVKLWMESSPGAQELFDVFGTRFSRPQFNWLLDVYAGSCDLRVLFATVVTLISSSPTIPTEFLSSKHGSHNELILATLKLFNAISAFGSGRERKSVFEAFPWDNKTLPKLLHMRRKGKAGEEQDALARPDIRTYYVLFILSMVDQDTASSVKAGFLEQRREVFMSIFKGLVQDPYSVIEKVLQVCWESLWSDPKIKRTTKVGLFNEVTISHLLKLYDRFAAEKQGGEHIPADIVHHFLLAICTRPGQGICFRDRGWYPRETNESGIIDEVDTEGTRQKGAFTGRIYNKILANVLRTLKVNEDARQQELALKIIAACPELVAGYWSGAALTLEPRLSSKWIANIAFAGQWVRRRILRKGCRRAQLGLSSTAQALVLIKCLRKLAELIHVFKMVEAALEEDEDEGQWSCRRYEVEKEARRRVPEFQVIVAFSQQNLSASSSTNVTKHALLSESSQRLLCLYQDWQVGPEPGEGSLASLSLSGENTVTSIGNGDKDQASSPLQIVKQLHVLRLLSGSDQFAWAGKVASSSHTYLYVLLKTFCNTRVRALRTTLRELLQHVLAQSVLFQEDPSEAELWLAALPSGCVRRGQGTETPDGAALTDEVDAIVAFLDDCAQRCLKTPYRYMEAMTGFHANSYIYLNKWWRKVMKDTAACTRHSTSLETSASGGQPFPNYPSIGFGIRRELSIARSCLRHLEIVDCRNASERSNDKTVADFLDRIEQIPIPTLESARMSSAFELVDWLRLVDVNLSPSDVSRIASVIRRLYEPQFGLSSTTCIPPTDLLLRARLAGCIFNATLPKLQNRRLRDILLATLYARPVTCTDLERAIRIITHGIGTVVQSAVIQELCMVNELAIEVHEALQGLIEVSFHSTVSEDKKILSPISSYWADAMKTSLSSGQFEEITQAASHNKLRYARPWIKFMNTEQLRAAVDLIQVDVKSPAVYETVEDILSALKQAMAQDSTLSKLPASKLLGLQGLLPGSVLLEDMLSEALVSQLPCGFDGQITSSDGQRLSTVLPILERETWTDSTTRIISVLLYTNVASSQIYASWLNSQKWTRLSMHHLASTLAAFLDFVRLSGGDLSRVNDEVLYSLIDRLFPKEPSAGHGSLWRLECIFRILELERSRQSRLLSALQDSIHGTRLVDLALETTYLARKIVLCNGPVRHFSNQDIDSEDSRDALANLENVASRHATLKPHLVEPLLTIIIQNRLSDTDVVGLAVALVTNTPLKPVVVNRLLQNILQHQHFFRICCTDGKPSQKNQVTSSHIEPLLRIYGGTMSQADRRLLSIMRLFEAEKSTSISAFFARWSPSPDTSVTNVLETVQSFRSHPNAQDVSCVPSLATNWRRERRQREAMLVECPPTTALGWVKVFRTNVVSLLIRCLSSKDPNIREAALCQIAKIWESVQKSDMQEKLQVIYVLRFLRNVMPLPANAQDPPGRIPTYASLILLHALRAIFYPSNFIYPRTARFLLQRPELDISDVPMLFGMLYSGSDEWKKERGWIIRMLGDGMASTDDWKVLKRRHTWDLVASLFQSSRRDATLRAGILEILANLTCNPQACTSLVLKSSLLSWIEMQVGDSINTESIAWLRILENIVFLADASKLERAIGGEWCAIICRCLSSLLQTKDKDISILNQTSAVLLRLSLIPGERGRPLRTVLEHAVEYLRHLETSINLHSRLAPKQDTETLANPPHRAQGLHEMPATSDPLRTWGGIVEALWRVSMSLEDVTRVWEMLTRRLLKWRALSGEEECQVGEWARQEVAHASTYREVPENLEDPKTRTQLGSNNQEDGAHVERTKRPVVLIRLTVWKYSSEPASMVTSVRGLGFESMCTSHTRYRQIIDPPLESCTTSGLTTSPSQWGLRAILSD